jgi:transposase-like protein
MSPTEIRARLAALELRGPGRRYPAELRVAIAAYAGSRHAEGRPLTAVAAELGLPVQTLRRWADGAPVPAGLVPVVTVPPRCADLRVRMPSGVVLEGLDLRAAVAVLQALG